MATTVAVFEMASGPDHKAAGSETRTLHCGGQRYLPKRGQNLIRNKRKSN